MSPIGIHGGGPWGVALALAARRAGSEVLLVSRRKQAAGKLSRITQTGDPAELAACRLIVLAVPSHLARTVSRELGDHVGGGHIIVHGIRGLSGDELSSISQIIREETPVMRVGALGGPVQADELTHGRPSVMVVGSQYPDVLRSVRAAFDSEWLHVHTTPDLRGLEWSSALVGCLSIGVGFAQQAEATPGLLAALISRGVDEAAAIAVADGAQEKTLYGLGGYSDLLASMALPDRPEVVLGRAIAQGASVAEAQEQAKLRIEAIELVPRIARFAAQRGVPADVFGALQAILQGQEAESILRRLFRSG